MATTTGRYLGVLLALNVIWLITATIWGSASGVAALSTAMFAGPSLISIIFYQVVLMRRGARITQLEADSIYYLGFLITLSALVCTVFDFIQNPNNPQIVAAVGSKFALGLISTGAGLFGRMVLQSRIPDDDSVSSGLGEYVENIGRINDRMTESSSKLDNLVNDVVRQAQDLGRKSTVETVRVISEELGPAVNDLKSLITDVNRSLGRFKEGRFQDLADASNQLAAGFEAAAQRIPQLTQEIGTASSALRGMASITEGLGSAASSAGSGLLALGESAGQISQTVNVGGAAVDGLGKSATHAKDIVDSLAESLIPLDSQIVVLAKTTSELFADMSGAATGLKRFGSALNDVPIPSLASGFKDVAASIDQVKGSIANFALEVDSLAGRPTAALTRSAGDIELTASKMTEASVALGTAMTRLAEEIRKAADLARAG